ncbi:hypothetical protein [Corynebacterium flavescens]|uniref:hypothetical protein n=1 Tax=Corynebacterium flavescens TaxID=28028 RepID=UPI0026489281|nr:hypothetical protein [Corynebacterium flavescens]MDN6430766.1 hypothetical protein [Corynebacterium flavescens]MDN6600849.1 hypothetical protein [Corynebacterium flavescens]MDN6823162.1 hypothetical protein [Corynebacterium flavescens]
MTAVAAVSLAAPSAFAAPENSLSSNATASSKIGEFLGASDSERGVWGSSKGKSEETGENPTTFSWLWYGYTLAATAGLIGTTIALNADNIEQAAAAAGIDLKLPF